MAYTLTYSSGTITVNDGTLNTDTSLQLPGRNFSGYGLYQDQNLINLMQSFASTVNPSNAMRGQLWFDSGSTTLKYNISPTKGSPTWVSVASSGPSVNSTFNTVTANSVITNTITTGGTALPGTVTGAWTLTNGSSFTIQKATTTELGAVKIDGSSITINGTGVISSVVPTAGVGAGGTLGGVKVDGSTISINGSGVISSTYTLPTANTSVLGGVKIDGSTITINGSGVISATPYSLPTATTSVLGGVKIDNVTVNINGSGVISVPKATTSSLGVVYVNPNTASPLTVDVNGMLNVGVATSLKAGVVRPDNTTITVDGVGIVSVPKASTNILGVVQRKSSSVGLDIDVNGGITCNLAGYLYPGVVFTNTATSGLDINAGAISLVVSGSGSVVVPNNGASAAITHSLGRIPVIVIWQSNAAPTHVILGNVTTTNFTIAAHGPGGTAYYAYW